VRLRPYRREPRGFRADADGHHPPLQVRSDERSHHGHHFSLRLSVRRDHVFEDSFHAPTLGACIIGEDLTAVQALLFAGECGVNECGGEARLGEYAGRFHDSGDAGGVVIRAGGIAAGIHDVGDAASGEDPVGVAPTLRAVAEAYPELKANTNFLQLQSQLQELENSIEMARRYYNAVVRDLNTAIVQFPSNLVASQFGLRSRPFFELEDRAQAAVPAVRFDG
jgi:hypothetical protein